MKPSDEFRYEHEVIRGKLALLEEQLPWVNEIRCSTSCLMESLAPFLRCHTEKEEHLLSLLPIPAGTPLAERIRHLRDEHENQRTRLAILHDLLTQTGPASAEQIAVQADYLIQDLRQHMAIEEAFLFPEIDLAAEGVLEAGEAAQLAYHTVGEDDEAEEWPNRGL